MNTRHGAGGKMKHDGHSRTDLLLELIANELLFLRIQLSPESDETDNNVLQEATENDVLGRVDEAIRSLRKQLGMAPFS
jgi:hypothetical protein